MHDGNLLAVKKNLCYYTLHDTTLHTLTIGYYIFSEVDPTVSLPHAYYACMPCIYCSVTNLKCFMYACTPVSSLIASGEHL